MSPLEVKKYLTPKMIDYLELRERNYTQGEIAKMWGCGVRNIERVALRARGRICLTELVK